MNTMLTLFSQTLVFKASKHTRLSDDKTISLLSIDAKSESGHETMIDIHLTESELDAIAKKHQIKIKDNREKG